MKRTLSFFTILAVLSFWIPCAQAEDVAQDLDPMVSPDVQATVTGEGSANTVTANQTDATVSAAGTVEEKKPEEKKVEKKKKEKTKKEKVQKASKKDSKKKSSAKKSGKPAAKHSKKLKKTAN